MPEYRDSLSVVSILFAIFPAASVINCLYVNLYKITNQIKKYLMSLILIIICSVLLNVICVMVSSNYLMIAIATTICYYIWLIYSAKDFNGTRIQKKDIIFLGGFLLIFFRLTRISNYLIGFIVYFVVILLWEVLMFKNMFIKLINIFKKNK